jgi:hypothetical protein
VCFVSNFDISTSELLVNYNLGDMIPLPMPKLKVEDFIDAIKSRYFLDQTSLDKINVSFPIHNYKDKFCNINEYFYAVGDLILEYKKRFKYPSKDTTTAGDLIRKNVQKHLDNYLFHCSNGLGRKFSQHELSGIRYF